MSISLSDMAKLMGSKGGSSTAKKHSEEKKSWGRDGALKRWAGHVKKTKGTEGDK